MSFNDNDPERAARNHRPAIIGIVVALVVAAIAYFAFMPGTDEQNEGIATPPPPAETTTTDAEGNEGGATPDIAPDSAAPVTPDGDAAEANEN